MSKLYNFKSAFDLVESMYGVEVPLVEFEDLGLYAWDLINNKHTRLYRYFGDTNEEGILELPCNVDFIEAVTIPEVDAQLTTATNSFLNYNSIYTEHYIEHGKQKDTDFYTPGKLIEYREGDGVLYLPRPYKKVCVLYHGILVDDEEGLPLITEKEQKAIAAFIAYTVLFKESIRKKDANTLQLAQVLKQEGLTKCTAARVPDHLSQNDMDRILDVKTRGDRKAFKKSFKPIE